MNKIINLQEYRLKLDKNKKFGKKYVSKIENVYGKDYLIEKDNIIENENMDNFNFLYENFKNINDDIKRGLVTPRELQLITNKLAFVLEKDDYSLSRIYMILCFYNAYRIYRNNFLELPKDDINLIVSLLVSFEQSHDIKKLDSISNFIFNKEILEKLKKLESNGDMLLHICENIVEEYLDSDINASVDYYANKEIESITTSREEEKNYGPDFLGYGIRTPEFLEKRLSENLENMSFALTPDKYFELKSAIEMLRYKISNMTEENRKLFFEMVRKIDVLENTNPKRKLEMILNYAETLFDVSNKIVVESSVKAK